MEHLYPIFLKLKDKKCLVVGGGKVAERKVETFMEYEAQIKLVSPEVTQCIHSWAEENKIEWQSRSFEDYDLQGVWLVFIATGDEATNKLVASLCRAKGILVNAVDDPPNCDFFVPSVLRRQSLCMAISTEGKSPMFAAKLRRELEEIFTDEYGEWVEILGKLREKVKNSPLDMEERKQFLKEIIYSDLLDLLKAGQKECVEERIEQCMCSLRE